MYIFCTHFDDVFVHVLGMLHALQGVLVKNVPDVHENSVSDTVDYFFKKNHSTHYLCHQAVYNANKFARAVKKRQKLQNYLDYNELKFERSPHKRPTKKTGFLGLWGKKVDSIEYYQQQVKELDEKLTMERERIFKDPKCIMPAAFVSFNSRWGAAVCAQTQQSKNPILWLTDWAPEPRDVYWKNLAIPFVSLSIRRLVISLAVFALVFFYIIPIAFVQSLANLDGLERYLWTWRNLILESSQEFYQVFPSGFSSWSCSEGFSMASSRNSYDHVKNRRARCVFCIGKENGWKILFLHAGERFLRKIPRTIGVSIPMKATFFITYIMVDGWAGMAGEILRLKPLIMFHLKNMLLVKTKRDREKAMNPKSIDFPETIPSLQLYFLMGAVYAVVTPILLPFILIFFAFAYFVYRHQVINVYNQRYESAAAFWPHVHTRIIANLLISQFLLLGLLSTKKAASSTPLLAVLPILTVTFHNYCKSRFEPAFQKYPLEEAVEKDAQDEVYEGEMGMKSFLSEAYLHPVLRSFEEVELVELGVERIPSQPTTELAFGLDSPESKVSPKNQKQNLEVVVEQHESVFTMSHDETSVHQTHNT
uniref:CSC1/OSCA1-like 7TM region domain-containing protein n=1 Tax=Lactuca sativa TaxID=4236 RepID=A0A9R1V7V1_LACSA|nr:hypothetical protein LSAT_V11C600305700 [Lactuca sativa]